LLERIHISMLDTEPALRVGRVGVCLGPQA